MFSRTEVMPNDNSPATLSLEFVWDATSTYWAGEIRVVDVYIADELRYTMKIPERAAQQTALLLKGNRAGVSAPQVNYLSIKNLDTTRKITLKAGIFNEKEGNTLTMNFDGSLSRDIRYTREDVSIKLDVSSFELGKHYKIRLTHSMKRETTGSPFWKGTDLHTVIEESGPSKQIASVKTPINPTSFFHSSPNPAESLSAEQVFAQRKDNAEDPQESRFFALALDRHYEEAIMHASEMENQKLGGRLILDLLKYQKELGLNINNMNDNTLHQTPLHRAAINKRWHAYFALVERGADSALPDLTGVAARDYRTQNGMSALNIGWMQQIRQDLFGDTAPEAEQFLKQLDQSDLSARPR